MIKFKKRVNVELVSIQEIETFESEIGYSLPEDYKFHLIEFNGGEPSIFNVCFNDNEQIHFTYFYALNYGNTDLKEMHEIGLDNLPDGYLEIGATVTGSIAINLNDNNKGAIYVFYSEGELELIADSFTEFIEGLAEIEEEE